MGEEVDLLLLKWPAGSAGQWFLAIPARVCHAGAILALPAAALQPEELDAGKEAAAEALVGPSLAVSMAIEGGADPDELLEVVLVEFGPGIRHQLEKKTPRGRRTFVGFHGDPRVLPCLAELEECVASWIDSGVVRSDAFYTAPESGEDAAEDPLLPQDDILAQLQLLQTAVEQRLGKLETQVQGLSNPQPGALRKGVAADGRSRQPDASEPGEANIRSQVPPPPRLPDEPGKGVETAKGSTRATPGAAEECEKGASVAEMTQLSMLQLMKDMQRPKAAKKTKRLPGLPIDLSEESDAEEEEKWSSSSRGGRGIEAVACHEVTPRTVHRAHGAEDGARCRSWGSGCVSAREVRADSSRGQGENRGVCLAWLRGDLQALPREQAKASPAPYLANDRGLRAVPHRRELDSGIPADHDFGAAVGCLGNSRLAKLETPVRVLQADGAEHGGRPHQRTEGGRMAGEEVRDRRVRPHRFLRHQIQTACLEEAIKPAVSAESKGVGLTAWLEKLIHFCRSSNLPLARYVHSTERTSVLPLAAGKTSDLFPCPPPYPWISPSRTFNKGPRRRKARWQVSRSVQLLVNLMICGLSHTATDCHVAPE